MADSAEINCPMWIHGWLEFGNKAQLSLAGTGVWLECGKLSLAFKESPLISIKGTVHLFYLNFW